MTRDSTTPVATAEFELGTPRLEASQRSSTKPSTQLVEDAGFLRSRVQQLNVDTQGLHRDTQLHEWIDRGQERGKDAPLDLLGTLADLGFSWRTIARMLGVSVPAIQKWRQGAKVSGENRRLLANLVAACDVISENYLVNDVASWFEMPLLHDVPVTPIDLYAAARYQLLFEYASGHTDTESLLTQFDPTWRETYRSGFEVFRGEDGQLSLRSKG